MNGTTSSETKFQPFMSLITEYDFDQLRNLIAKEIGLQTKREHFNEIYDFLGSEGTLIKYLNTINLYNDKYNTTFHCHPCENNFNKKCMIGSISCIIRNLEYSICAKLLTTRCQHCQTTITDNFEKLNSEFISIPPYDGVRLTPFEYYPSVSFLGNVNTIFYTLLSTE